VKFLTDAKYPQNDPEQSREYKAGEVHDLDRNHAERWIRRGVAVEVPAEERKPHRGKATEGLVPAPPAKGAAPNKSEAL
jgi:hypothetical protein